MIEYPQSPYGQTRDALSQLQDGRMSRAAFLVWLDGFGRKVDGWKAQLSAVPTGQEYPEGQELVDDAAESLQAVYDGLDLLREYAETRAPESSAEALELMAEASDFLVQLLGITEQNLEELENMF
jgi:hypothetical protein